MFPMQITTYDNIFLLMFTIIGGSLLAFGCILLIHGWNSFFGFPPFDILHFLSDFFGSLDSSSFLYTEANLVHKHFPGYSTIVRLNGIHVSSINIESETGYSISIDFSSNPIKNIAGAYIRILLVSLRQTTIFPIGSPLYNVLTTEYDEFSYPSDVWLSPYTITIMVPSLADSTVSS